MLVIHIVWLCVLAFEYAVKLRRAWIVNSKTGEDWMKGYMGRNPDFSIRNRRVRASTFSVIDQKIINVFNIFFASSRSTASGQKRRFKNKLRRLKDHGFEIFDFPPIFS